MADWGLVPLVVFGFAVTAWLIERQGERYERLLTKALASEKVLKRDPTAPVGTPVRETTDFEEWQAEQDEIDRVEKALFPDES